MKTIGEMIKPSKDVTKKMSHDLDEMLENSAFRELVSKLSVSREVLSQNRTSLVEASEEYDHCTVCKNLLACKNKIKGYAYLPSVRDGKITFCYKECKFKQKIEETQKYLKNVYIYDVPSDIRQAKMKYVYKEDKNRFEVIKYLIGFIKEYKQGEKPKGVYLHGNFGSGKTYLIAACFNELAEEGIKSAIVFWPEFLRELKASFGTDFDEKFEKIKRSPLLLIDDIGAESMTAWARDEILCPLVQYRMAEGIPTFFTSNLDLETLEKHLSVTRDKVDDVKAKRIIERIKQLTIPEKMVSENLRK